MPKEENVLTKNKKILTEKEIKEEIINYSKESLDSEYKREENLIRQSSSNLTTVSILLVSLLTIIFELLDRFPNRVKFLVAIFGALLSSILFISILFSYKAQWLYKKKYKNTANELLKHIEKHKDDYSKRTGFQDQSIADIIAIQESLIPSNNKRVNDIIFSSILIYVFLTLLAIFAIVILIAL